MLPCTTVIDCVVFLIPLCLDPFNDNLCWWPRQKFASLFMSSFDVLYVSNKQLLRMITRNKCVSVEAKPREGSMSLSSYRVGHHFLELDLKNHSIFQWLYEFVGTEVEGTNGFIKFSVLLPRI